LWESFAAYPNLDAVILLTRNQPLVDREIIIGLKTKREEADHRFALCQHARHSRAF